MSASEHREPSPVSRISWVARLVILIGLVFRLRSFAANRSFWIDEAMLARNVVDRTFAELAQPLDYNQGAPLGFLYVEKALESLRNRDYVLRLFPLLSGCLSLLLMYRLLSDWGASPSDLIALALFAVGGRLIYYTTELKQYSSDVLVALLLYLAAVPLLTKRATAKHWGLLAFGGIAGVWFSHPALFALASLGLILALQYARDREWNHLWLIGLVGLAWSLDIALLYLVSLRHLAASTELTDFWRAFFMPLPPWRNLPWLGSAMRQLFVDPVGLSVPLVGLSLAVGGVVLLLKRRWQWGCAVLLPLLMALLASGFHKYPFGSRMLLFAIPGLLIAIAEGLEGVRLALWRIRPLAMGVWLALALVLVWGPAAAAVDDFVQPSMGEHIKPAMTYLQVHRQPGDTIYVYYGAYHAYKYYAPIYGLDDSGAILGISSRADPQQYIQDIHALAGKGRVWLLFSHVHTGSAGNEETFLLEHLDKAGTREEQMELPGASLYLYLLDS